MEAALLALIGIITTAGGFIGRYILAELKAHKEQIQALQDDKLAAITQIAELKAQLATLEDARKERDALRELLQHREAMLDRVYPGWRIEHADDLATTGATSNL